MNGIQDCQKSEFAQNVNPPIGTEKKCTKCGEIKEEHKFREKRTPRCRLCEKEYRKEKRKEYAKMWAHRPHVIKKRKEQHWKRVYGITPEEFTDIFNKQAGRCAICEKLYNLWIDHCHANGHVRGLLCVKCNAGLGMFMDSKKLLQRAINYL